MTLLQRTLCTAVTLSSLAASAQALDADWLYLSNSGSWVSRTTSLLSEQTQVQLPVAQLQAHQFWWQSDVDNLRLTWSQPDPLGLPNKGDPVEISGEGGLWLVKDVSASHLILQQGRNVRYWPQSQWHLLSWTSTAELGLSLTVRQSEKSKGDLFYAWQTPDVSAEVRYRLQALDGEAQLVQELVVINRSDNDYQAQGYSYAQVGTRPPVMMARVQSMESATSSVGTPQSGQSQGVPTLTSDQPIELAASSNVWLPVTSTPLQDVERQYQMSWDTRQQGFQQSQTALKIRSRTELPDIAGPIKVGIFDRQIAVLDSQYQPADKNEAVIQLGPSALVTMHSRLVREGQWQLEFVNRTDEPAAVELTLNHWNGQTSQQVPMTVRIPADGEKTVQLELSSTGAIKIPR